MLHVERIIWIRLHEVKVSITKMASVVQRFLTRTIISSSSLPASCRKTRMHICAVLASSHEDPLVGVNMMFTLVNFYSFLSLKTLVLIWVYFSYPHLELLMGYTTMIRFFSRVSTYLKILSAGLNCSLCFSLFFLWNWKTLLDKSHGVSNQGSERLGNFGYLDLAVRRN